MNWGAWGGAGARAAGDRNVLTEFCFLGLDFIWGCLVGLGLGLGWDWGWAGLPGCAGGELGLGLGWGHAKVRLLACLNSDPKPPYAPKIPKP